MTPKPEVLNLLEKLQNLTPDKVDEERGSFEIGDNVIYDMLGGVLSNSDLVRTLGITEHTLRITHNGAVAKIVEAKGEEISRYDIIFEDGFTIRDVATSELKAPEPSGSQPKPQEEPNLDAEELHLEDYSKDDLDKVKSKSAKTGDAIRKVEDDELKIAPDKVNSKKESKTVNEGSVKKGDRVEILRGSQKGKIGTVVDLASPEEYPPNGQLDVKVEGTDRVVYLGWDDIHIVKNEESTNEKALREEKCPKCGSDSFAEGNEAGDYMCAECGYDESVGESKLKEETEFTPSREEFKKIGDEKLKLLLKNARKSQDYWKKENDPEKVSAAGAAIVRYEEEVENRERQEDSEKKESTHSFMQKQEPLWLCNECYNTYRSDKTICAICESTKVERIVEQAKDVFQVTWTDTDTDKEESTRVMAYDKTDAEREAKRTNRKITKVEGPITSEDVNQKEQSCPGCGSLATGVDGLCWKCKEEQERRKARGQAAPYRESNEEETKVPFDERDRKVTEDGEKKYYVFYNDYATKPPTRTRIKKVFIAKSKQDAADQGQLLLQKEAPEGEWEVTDAEVLEEREQKVTQDDPITAIEIVTSKVDPDAYNIRVVQLPEGSIVILDSVSDREIALERGKQFAKDLNANFLGIIDEKKVEEQGIREGNLTRKLKSERGKNKVFTLYMDGVDIGEYEEKYDYVRAKETDRLRSKLVLLSSIRWNKEGIQKIYGKDVTVGRSSPSYSSKPSPDVVNVSSVRGRYKLAEIEVLLPELRKEVKKQEEGTLKPGPNKIAQDIFGKKYSELDGDEKQEVQVHMKSSKFKRKYPCETRVEEQEEEDTFVTVAKGIADREIADKLAAEKEGQVVADEEDDKKFAVLVKDEK